jgi:hypothetical protein
MSFLRSSAIFRPTSLRPVLSAAPRTRIQARFASQDYGSGEGNPAGENPQQQGKNPSENLEHPGPAPPKVAQDKGPSPNEGSGGVSKSEQASSESKGSSGGSEPTKKDVAPGVKGAQPKILSENPPGEHDESVKQHNKEMDNRAEKAFEQVSNEDAKNDKAPPGFWSGKCSSSIADGVAGANWYRPRRKGQRAVGRIRLHLPECLFSVHDEWHCTFMRQLGASGDRYGLLFSLCLGFHSPNCVPQQHTAFSCNAAQLKFSSQTPRVFCLRACEENCALR